MRQTIARIGPEDNGRRMTLEEFEPAETKDAFLYELGRGVIVVSDIPNLIHFALYDYLRELFAAYRRLYPGAIFRIGGGAECKILIPGLDSERHPDLAVYLSAPPDVADVWRSWMPDLAIEIVSPGSESRDYVEKREEYLAAGVKEYWIVDPSNREVVVLRRSRGKWSEKTLSGSDHYRPKMLPGFELRCDELFNAIP